MALNSAKRGRSRSPKLFDFTILLFISRHDMLRFVDHNHGWQLLIARLEHNLTIVFNKNLRVNTL